MLHDLFCHSETKNNLRTICQFCSACSVKICSVNLDCETTFLTLSILEQLVVYLASYDLLKKPDVKISENEQSVSSPFHMFF